MLAVFRFAGWYADTSALPRYCEDPRGAIERVGEIISGDAPVGKQNRRPYLVAAKLIFLVPQKGAEPDPEYLTRLSRTISETCSSSL